MNSTPPNPSGLCMCGCGGAAPIATRSYGWKGVIKGQPQRYIAGHQCRPHPRMYEVEDRGYKTPCWVWKYATAHAGYGIFYHPPAGHTSKLAHRVFYERYVGPIPDGRQLDHLCRQRDCVNPDHLEIVSGPENIRRGKSAKLTHDIASIIRSPENAHRSNRDLAREFGVDHSVISRVRNRKAWSDE